MKKKAVRERIPAFLPRRTNGVAYYLENDEDFKKALFEYCGRHNISLHNWHPYYEKDRKNYDLFLHEFSFGNEKLDIPEDRKPGWYLFQTYEYEDSYWSDNREQCEIYKQTRVTVDSISAAGYRVGEFIGQFTDMPAALTLLSELSGYATDLPEDIKHEAAGKINDLKELFEAYDEKGEGHEDLKTE